MFKAVVFDLDGTIADTIDTIHYYGNRALEKFNLGEIEKENYKYHVGAGYENLIKNMLNEKNAFEDKLFEDMKKFYHDDYETDSLYLSKIYDGIEQLIEYLKENGFKLAVLSNKPYGAVGDVINHFFEKGTFDMCVGGGMYDAPLKPEPTMLIKMLEEMEIKKDECIYIGDTNIDIKTGINADVLTIGALWGFRTEKELVDAGAKYVANTPYDVIKLIDTMQKQKDFN